MVKMVTMRKGSRPDTKTAMPAWVRKRPSNEITHQSIRRFIEEFSAATPTTSAVEDLLRGRR